MACNKHYRGTSPEIRRLLKAAVAAGWTVSTTNKSHYRIDPPEGVDERPIGLASTPSDRNGWRLVRSRMRRAGIDC
jgi:hypothetical protein